MRCLSLICLSLSLAAVGATNLFAQTPPKGIGCSLVARWSFGDTWKTSDTRSCGMTTRMANRAFVPGLRNRRTVANMTPCSGYGSRISYYSTGGRFIMGGTRRPGCPNGRVTFDSCPGPIQLANRGILRMWMKIQRRDGVFECYFIPNTRRTIRNGQLVPHKL
ncbi:MAG TPA: hypothetical protein PKD37_05870 [Oligoflexia bacterium]|nr:hypothetical protein [Oligoflexia bacterium]HMP27490.1 hypothetical protein [Oligoflexia bacterium]